MPFIWVALAIPVLLLLQRWIHTHLHGVSLLLTGKPERAVIIYSLVLLPGVVIHELSHWLMASLLGVRTGAISVIPQRQPDGSVQLGYVEYYKGHTLGAFRESLIGGAPLMAGTAVILLIGFHVFGVTQLADSVQTGELDKLLLALGQLFGTNDFFVWLYLLFAIANAMMPSPSDRRAWPAFLTMIVILAVVLSLIGIQQAVWAGIAGPVATVFGYLGIALSMAIGVDLFFMVLIAAVEGLIGRIRGVAVVYSSKESPPGSKKMVL